MNFRTTQAAHEQPHASSDAQLKASLEEKLMRLARLDGYVGERARSQLVQQHYSWIKQRCFYTLGNEADANDAAQEVALRMYRALSKFEGRSSIRTWLHTILHHECVNLIRKRQRSILSEHMQALVALHEIDLRDNRSHAEPATDAVQQSLNALPAQAREVLQLRFISELSLEDIGVVLGISLSATKMRLYRALDQFKGVYRQSDENDVTFA